jgi:superoxide dismutase
MYLKNKYFGAGWIILVSPLYNIIHIITTYKLQSKNPGAFDKIIDLSIYSYVAKKQCLQCMRFTVKYIAFAVLKCGS